MTLAEAIQKVRDTLPPRPIVAMSEEWIIGQAKEMMREQEELRKKKEKTSESARRRQAQATSPAGWIPAVAQGELPENKS